MVRNYFVKPLFRVKQDQGSGVISMTAQGPFFPIKGYITFTINQY